MKQLLRALPAIHEIQSNERYEAIRSTTNLSNVQLKKFVQQATNFMRKRLLNGDISINQPTKENLLQMILDDVEEKTGIFTHARLTRVINGTGIVLHTNLGRARLSKQAIQHVADVASGYSNLEFQLSEGKRGSRHDIIEDLLQEVTGAEAAMVVNNNAAAVFLILRAFAKEREVIVSRGQLVEIGGSFRISSIMEESGATLIEVGTTNKTHVYDYENAINDETSMILRVHTSNFKTIGFTESVSAEKLVDLKKQNQNLILYEDLGSGSIYDFKEIGIGNEPVVKEVIESGVDLVSFSGDKLLGGPQAGIIAGKKTLIDQLKRHQLARAFRVDKMTIAALEQTLKSYLYDVNELSELPIIRDVGKPLEQIRAQAETFAKQLVKQSLVYEVTIQEDFSQIGGGTMPEVELPTFTAAISHKGLSTKELAEKLRMGAPAIVARVKDDRVTIDFRTISEEESSLVVEGFMNFG